MSTYDRIKQNQLDREAIFNERRNQTNEIKKVKDEEENYKRQVLEKEAILRRQSKARNKEEEAQIREENRIKEEELAQKKAEEYNRKIAKAQDNINFIQGGKLLTTGFSFEGYNIVEYKGIVSGDVILSTGFFAENTSGLVESFGNTLNPFSNRMAEAKKMTENELIQNAAIAGANGIIGIDVDYQVIGNNMVAVSMNGTAVRVEKPE